MPSSRKVRRAVLEALSDLPSGTQVVDIGAGWGGLIARVARERPDLTVEGFERSPVPYLVARARLVAAAAATKRFGVGGRKSRRRHGGHVRRHGGPPPRVRFGDFRRVGPEDGACYITYLSPEGMKWIRELFERRLPRHVRLVSAVFAVRGWTPARTSPVPDMHRSRVYVYELK
ncbi:MAG: hypothetical protein GVY29_11235 [Spirochaetes bacterium]|jgi:hypothetical protein|nr:hypothetical protein [Spirochaetota bacterium]